MEGNKDDAERSIILAKIFIKQKNYKLAEQYLIRAEKLFPTLQAKRLLLDITVFRNRRIDPKEEIKKAHSSSEVAYPVEHMEAVKRIHSCGNYYQILGVNKNTSESDIRKAYKKLALQLHPDKNTYPGAAEAFKIVTQAMCVLTNPEKRKTYDLFGFDEDHLAPRHQRQQADYSSKDIFNIFFAHGHGKSYVHKNGHWQRKQNTTQHQYKPKTNPPQPHEERENNFSTYLRTIPAILVVILFIASNLFASESVYSLQPTAKYSVLRKTQNLHVPYYVQRNFPPVYRNSLKRMEKSIEEEYLDSLRHSCYREKNYRDLMIWKAKTIDDKELFESALSIKLSSCELLRNLRNRGY